MISNNNKSNKGGNKMTTKLYDVEWTQDDDNMQECGLSIEDAEKLMESLKDQTGIDQIELVAR
jgi:hypothetical protein